MTVSIYAAINLLINLFACAVLIVLSIVQFIDRDTKSRQGRVFLSVLIMTAMAFISDSVAWLAGYYSGTIEWVMCLVANYLAYNLLILSMFGYSCYIAAAATGKERAVRVLVAAGIIATVAYVIAIIVTQFNGMIYRIEAGNIYQRGPLYTVVLLYGVFYLLLDLALLIACRKNLTRKQKAILSSYVFINLAAFILELFFSEILFAHVTLMLSLLIIYVSFQAQLSKQRKIELANSRIAIMLSQIQPHFLFNSLTVIENLCVEDPPQAQEAVHDFAAYLRGNIDSLTRQAAIPFTQELEHARRYLTLEQKRLCNAFEVIEEIEADCFMIPPLTLQPMVENAVRHGIVRYDEGGRLILGSHETEDSWLVTVADNGDGFNPDEPSEDGKTHVGIENVRARLAALCGGSLEIDSAIGKGTTVTICIPKKGRLDRK